MSDFADDLSDFADELERFERDLVSVEKSSVALYDLDEIKPELESRLEEVESLECRLRAMFVRLEILEWPGVLRDVDKLKFRPRLQKVQENAQKKLDQIQKITSGVNQKGV